MYLTFFSNCETHIHTLLIFSTDCLTVNKIDNFETSKLLLHLPLGSDEPRKYHFTWIHLFHCSSAVLRCSSLASAFASSILSSNSLMNGVVVPWVIRKISIAFVYDCKASPACLNNLVGRTVTNNPTFEYLIMNETTY